MTTIPNTTDLVTKRHPIRGALYGLSLGIGAAVYLVTLSVMALSVVNVIIVVVVCIVLGGLWGAFAPPKKPKGQPPAVATDEPVVDADDHAPSGVDGR